MSDEVTVTFVLEGWGWRDKELDSKVAVFGPPGRWYEYRGPKYDLMYARIAGPSKQAIANFIQAKRDEYGHRDTMHCGYIRSKGWVEESPGHWYLPIILALTTEGHKPEEKLPELSDVLMEIPDYVPQLNEEVSMRTMAEKVSEDIDQSVLAEIAESLSKNS